MRTQAEVPSAGPGTSKSRRRLLLFAALAVLATLVLGTTLATAVAPVVTVENASNVKYTSADVEGTVNPDGQSTTYRFQYVTDAQFQQNLTESLPGFEGAATGVEESTETSGPVTGTLNGLSPATEYHLRLQAENADGQTEAVAANTFTTLAVTAPVVSADDATAITTSSAHFSGSVEVANVDTAFDASCGFQYITQAKYEAAGNSFDGAFPNHSESVQCDEPNSTVEATEPPEAVAVQADATALEPSTTYRLRISATNLGGTSTDEAQTFTTDPVPITLGEELVHTQLGLADSGEVAIGGYVNPHNLALIDCSFEYGRTESYGQSIACESLPPATNKPNLVRAELSGLTPGQSYHFRLSVTNGTGTLESADGSFVARKAPPSPSCPNPTVLGAERLPDCRAWELVSPMGKLGGDVLQVESRTRAAEDGSAINYGSLQAFGDTVGNANISSDYIAKRSTNPAPGNSGWATHSISPVQDPLTVAGAFQGHDPFWEYLSPDLSTGIFRAFSALTPAPNVEKIPTIYRRDDLLQPGSGAYQLLSNCPDVACPTPLPSSGIAIHVPRTAGTSADLEQIIFESIHKLAPNAPEPGANPEFTDFCLKAGQLCDVKLYKTTAGGDPEYIGMRPAIGSVSCGSSGSVCVVAPRAKAGQGARSPQNYTHRTITADGSRVFFHVGASSNSVSGALYMRDDQGTADPADDTTTAIAGVAGTSELTSPESPLPARFETASTGVDEQGSRVPARVFFTTLERLTEEDEDGQSDVYIWDEDKPAGERLSLISPDAEPGDEGEAAGVVGVSEDGSRAYFVAFGQLVAGMPRLGTVNTEYGLYAWHEGELDYVGRLDSFDAITNVHRSVAITTSSRLSPDGHRLLFAGTSGEGLLSAHAGTDPDSSSGAQLYLYDADAKELSCASCAPAGPTSGAARWWVAVGKSGAATTVNRNRMLSEDGRYVFFTSAARLVPQDTNGREDAYRYDSRTGKPELLSSGKSSENSYFLEASANGSDAFFATREALSGWDTDDNVDLYDARIGGGFPEPPPPPPTCVGDACQPAPTDLNEATPGSATVRGPGNQRSRRPNKSRCPQGKAKAKGAKSRCAKAKKKQNKRAANANRRAGR